MDPNDQSPVDAPQQPFTPPENSSQPIVETPPPVSPEMPPAEPIAPKKSHVGLIIGLLAGGFVLLSGLALLFIFLVIPLLTGGNIKTVEDLQAAIKNQSAMNCVVSGVDGSGNKMTLQTTKNWDKVKIQSTESYLGKSYDVNVLVLKGDTAYAWSDSLSLATKTKYSSDVVSSINDFTDSIVNLDPADNTGDNAVTIECSSPSKADFSVPNKNWQDTSSSAFDSEVQNDSNSNSNTNNNSNSNSNNNSGSDSAISINATIEDTAVGEKFQATKLVWNAFTVPQSVIDQYVAFEDKIPVMVYVTASSISNTYNLMTQSVGLYEVSFYDNSSPYRLSDVNSIDAVASLAKNAGYDLGSCDATTTFGEIGSVSCWYILMVDPTTVTKESMYMKYDRMSYQIYGGSGEVIPAKTFTAQLIQ